jgi:hypothetical protein
MRVFNLAAAFAVSAGAILTPVTAFAQDCTCIAPAQQGVVGRFLSADGEVLTTGRANYVPAVAGTAISVGSEISVGSLSGASIVVGQTCQLTLDQNTLTRIARLTNGNLCVATNATTPTAGPVTAQSFSWAPILIGGGLMGGVVALYLGQGDDPVSQ